MKTFKLTIEYDGTDFCGWQRQAKGERTVQGELERVLEKIFKRHIVVCGSGRTDSKVHARGQVAHIRLETDKDPKELQAALNYNLPTDVVILSAQIERSKFHAQMSAKEKTYSYTLLNRSYAAAIERRTSYFFPRKLNVSLMKREAKELVGKKDFSSFANVDRRRTGDAVRTISRLDVQKKGDYIIFTITGSGFLYKMVRNIVGTLLDIGSGRFPPGSIRRMLKKKDRRVAGVAAAPQGLCLEEVVY